MIDIENELFTSIVDRLSNEVPNISYSSVFVNCPTSYPFVSIEEIDNYHYSKSQDNTDIENNANVTYEINIFTKDNIKKKTLSKQILNIIDTFMYQTGFNRLSKTPIQGDDETIYRIVLRYSAVVSNKNEIFRR